MIFNFSFAHKSFKFGLFFTRSLTCARTKRKGKFDDKLTGLHLIEEYEKVGLYFNRTLLYKINVSSHEAK